jgi:hypothetical protein
MAIGAPFEVASDVKPTRELLQLLERLDPFRSLGSELENRMRERIREQVAFFPGEDVAARFLFRGAQEQQALGILLELEQLPVRQALEGLAKTIEAREEQEDYWPEGRLNAGVASALVGDLASAQHYLEQAIDILNGKGFGREEAMMLA